MAEDPPIGGRPVVFRPETFARHDEATRYVEGLIRTRDPREGSGRWPGAAPGAWGLLASGATITGGLGLTLGSGTVTLCDRAGTALKDPAETVTVYNPGGPVSGPAVLPLEWTVGDWSVCGCVVGTTCEISASVVDCSGASVSGATVMVKDSAGSTVGTCTTGESGQCSVAVSSSGTYTVEASMSGFYGSNAVVSVTCPTIPSVTLTLDPSTYWQPTVTGCNGFPLPGATVSINGGVYGTDSAGQTQPIALPAAVNTYTVTATGFSPYSSFVGITCNNIYGGGVILSVAAGFHCIQGCVYPLTDTIYCTTPLGLATLYYSSTIGPVSNWVGCISFPATVSTCSGTGTVGGTTTVKVTWQDDLTSPSVGVSYFTFNGNFTPGAFPGDCSGFGPGCSFSGLQSRTAATTMASCTNAWAASGTISGIAGVGAIFNGAYTFTQ